MDMARPTTNVVHGSELHRDVRTDTGMWAERWGWGGLGVDPVVKESLREYLPPENRRAEELLVEGATTRSCSYLYASCNLFVREDIQRFECKIEDEWGLNFWWHNYRQ